MTGTLPQNAPSSNLFLSSWLQSEGEATRPSCAPRNLGYPRTRKRPTRGLCARSKLWAGSGNSGRSSRSLPQYEIRTQKSRRGLFPIPTTRLNPSIFGGWRTKFRKNEHFDSCADGRQGAAPLGACPHGAKARRLLFALTLERPDRCED